MVKDFLIKIRRFEIEIKTLIDLKNRMKENILTLNSNISEKVGGSKNLNRIEKDVINYVNLERVIEDKIRTLEENKKLALSIINNLNDTVYKVILIERYINNESWDNISFVLKKTKRWTRSLHNSALIEVNNIKV